MKKKVITKIIIKWLFKFHFYKKLQHTFVKVSSLLKHRAIDKEGAVEGLPFTPLSISASIKIFF